MDLIDKLGSELNDLVRRFIPGQPSPALRKATRSVAPVERKVLVISYNPRIRSRGGRPLTQVLGWFDPQQLTQQYIADLDEASHGYVHYRMVEFKDLDEWPLKADGFRYDENAFLSAWEKQSGFHDPDAFDYERLVVDQHLIERVEAHEIDEVWLWGMPFAGFWESHMAGPDAYFCNSPAMRYLGHGVRRFVIMGFNYQRDVGQALHSFGHRVESMMDRIWSGHHGDDNLWQRFARSESTHPGQAQAGNVHFAPNSTRDYELNNTRFVQSGCDDWLTFPLLPGRSRAVNNTEWGGGDERAHMLWWLKRIPHVAGETQGISNNWWEHLADPDCIP